jgi:hypothetical protein
MDKSLTFDQETIVEEKIVETLKIEVINTKDLNNLKSLSNVKDLNKVKKLNNVKNMKNVENIDNSKDFKWGKLLTEKERRATERDIVPYIVLV